MVVFLQYNICDSRKLKAINNVLLEPDWKNIKCGKDFIKGAGSIIQRTKKGLESYMGENHLCINKNGMKGFRCKRVDKNTTIFCIAKHIYSDGDFMHRYEFVFKVFCKSKVKLTKGYIDNIFDQILSLDFKIRGRDNVYKQVKFINFFRDLKNFHLYCTTETLQLDLQNINDIQICTPQFLLKIENNDKIEEILIPKEIKLFNDNLSIEIVNWSLSFGSNSYRVWVITDISSDNLARLLRIAILRIYSDIECVKFLSRSIDINRSNYDVDKIRYFYELYKLKFSKNDFDQLVFTGHYELDNFIIDALKLIEPGIIIAIKSILILLEKLNVESTEKQNISAQKNSGRDFNSIGGDVRIGDVINVYLNQKIKDDIINEKD